MTVYIRGCRAGDEADLYDICVRTGSGGEDASDLYANPELLGHIYVGPYVQLATEFAFVVEDDIGVGGYVLGTADTRAFENACEREWWPSLRRRYPLPSHADESLDARLVRHVHSPPTVTEQLQALYPAHLHIDLLPRLQGQAYGQRLLTVLFDELAAAGAQGVHLEVGAANHRAIGFYRQMGFDELERSTDSLVMARRLRQA